MSTWRTVYQVMVKKDPEKILPDPIEFTLRVEEMDFDGEIFQICECSYRSEHWTMAEAAIDLMGRCTGAEIQVFRESDSRFVCDECGSFRPGEQFVREDQTLCESCAAFFDTVQKVKR